MAGARQSSALLSDVAENRRRNFALVLRSACSGSTFRNARQVDQDEEHIADFAFDAPAGDSPLRASASSSQLFVKFVEHLVGVFPIESDGGRFG